MSIFEGSLPNNTGNRQMKEEWCARAWDYLQKTSGLPLNAETIKKVHKMMKKGGKYRKSHESHIESLMCSFRIDVVARFLFYWARLIRGEGDITSRL